MIADVRGLIIRLIEVNGDCEVESDSAQRALCEMWLENRADKRLGWARKAHFSILFSAL